MDHGGSAVRFLYCFFLMCALAGRAEATVADRLTIYFRGFSGSNCSFVVAQSGLFLDQWSSSLNRGIIPWEKLNGVDMLKRAIVLDLRDIPSQASPWEVYFRMYALHTPTSADQYESHFRLTQEFVQTLVPGAALQEDLPTEPTYEPEKKRRCTLTVQFVLI